MRIVCTGTEWFISEKHLIPHIAKMDQNTTQAITTGTTTVIEFDTSIEDNASLISNLSSSSARITIKRPGRYLIATRATISSLATRDFLTNFITVNAVIQAYAIYWYADVTYTPRYPNHEIWDCAVGDYIQLRCNHNFGSNRSTYVVSTFNRTSITVTEIIG